MYSENRLTRNDKLLISGLKKYIYIYQKEEDRKLVAVEKFPKSDSHT